MFVCLGVCVYVSLYKYFKFPADLVFWRIDKKPAWKKNVDKMVGSQRVLSQCIGSYDYNSCPRAIRSLEKDVAVSAEYTHNIIQEITTPSQNIFAIYQNWVKALTASLQSTYFCVYNYLFIRHIGVRKLNKKIL